MDMFFFGAGAGVFTAADGSSFPYLPILTIIMHPSCWSLGKDAPVLLCLNVNLFILGRMWSVLFRTIKILYVFNHFSVKDYHDSDDINEAHQSCMKFREPQPTRVVVSDMIFNLWDGKSHCFK